MTNQLRQKVIKKIRSKNPLKGGAQQYVDPESGRLLKSGKRQPTEWGNSGIITPTRKSPLRTRSRKSTNGQRCPFENRDTAQKPTKKSGRRVNGSRFDITRHYKRVARTALR